MNYNSGDRLIIAMTESMARYTENESQPRKRVKNADMSALTGTAAIAIAAMSLPGSTGIVIHSAASHMKCRYIFFARVRSVVIRAIMVTMDTIVNSVHNAAYIFNPNGVSAANVARDGMTGVVMPFHRHVQM